MKEEQLSTGWQQFFALAGLIFLYIFSITDFLEDPIAKMISFIGAIMYLWISASHSTVGRR